MAGEKNDRARDREISRKFERQGRRLSRKWMKNAVSGIFLLALIVVALQFTSYRDVPMEIFEAAKGYLQKLTSGKSAPVEPDPKYW